jgi:hypothetical protein
LREWSGRRLPLSGHVNLNLGLLEYVYKPSPASSSLPGPAVLGVITRLEAATFRGGLKRITNGQTNAEFAGASKSSGMIVSQG